MAFIPVISTNLVDIEFRFIELVLSVKFLISTMLPFMISQSYDGGINMEYFIFFTLLRKTCIKKGIHKHIDVLKIFTDRELSESSFPFP